MTSDGAVFLNDSLIATLDVGEGFIDQSISRVKCEIAEILNYIEEIGRFLELPIELLLLMMVLPPVIPLWQQRRPV